MKYRLQHFTLLTTAEDTLAGTRHVGANLNIFEKLGKIWQIRFSEIGTLLGVGKIERRKTTKIEKYKK